MVILSPGVLSAVEVGMTQEELVRELGEPTGKMDMGSSEMWTYYDTVIEIKEGNIVHIDGDPSAAVKTGAQELNVRNQMEAEGLVLYQGEWIAPEEKQKRIKELAWKSISKIKDISKEGREVVIRSLLVKGKVTIILFYGQWKHECKTLIEKIKKEVHKKKDLYLRTIDIVGSRTPVAKQNDIWNVPMVFVYGHDGKLIGYPATEAEEIEGYIEEALRQIDN